MVTDALITEINCENNDFLTYEDLGTEIPENLPLSNEDYKNKIGFQRVKGNILFALCYPNDDKFKLIGYIRVSIDDYIKIATPNVQYNMKAGRKNIDVNVVPCMSINNSQYMNIIYNIDMLKTKHGFQFSVDTAPNINITRYDNDMNIIGTNIIHQLYDFKCKGQYTSIIHRVYDIFTRYTDIPKEK